MDEIATLVNAFKRALHEPSLVTARSRLRNIFYRAKDLSYESERREDLFILLSDTSSAIADISRTAADKQKWRSKSRTACQRGLKVNPRWPLLAVTNANHTVDWYYDKSSPRVFEDIRSDLSDARKICGSLLKTEKQTNVRIQLLVQIASVLRCQAQIHPADDRNHTEHAIRTSSAATREDPASALAQLDLGQSYWAAARCAKDEEKYFSLMQQAEENLFAAHHKGLGLATLGLARLYRQTYRPAKAIEWFSKFADREQNKNRVFLESFLVGEAAVSLLHGDYEESYRREKLVYARDLLSEAIDSGYESARLLIPLARIRAALGDNELAFSSLRRLTRDGKIDWKIAIEMASREISNDRLDIIHASYALGLDDAMAWNGLGTFAFEVLDDRQFSLNLYETAENLYKKSPVIHTNIARILLLSSNQSDLIAAKEHLEKAKNYADFSFKWWRPLYLDVCKKLVAINPPVLLSEKERSAQEEQLFEEIQKEFYILENSTNDSCTPQKRGKIFESLFLKLLSNSFGTSNVKGNQIANRLFQSDASFTHNLLRYRVEVSWDTRRNGPDDVCNLVAQLDQPGLVGLLVSMGGFTRHVQDAVDNPKINQNHVILLLDAPEVIKLFRGEFRFESLIEEKLSKYNEKIELNN